MLKLESLRIFVTVANAGNINDAASTLNRTQSAISMSLKQLEKTIGSPLFESDRKNALTALGRFTFDTASLQIQSYDAAILAIRAFAANKIGRLSVSSVPSVAASLIPDVLPEFLAERQGVTVEMLDTDSRSVARMVDNGLAELGIGGKPNATARLSFTPLFSDRFRVLFTEGSPLAKIDRKLVWSDLEAATFIRNEASDAIELPELRASYYAANLIVRNVTSLLALVRAGMGITLLPALATADLPRGVVARDIDFRGSLREVGLIARKNASLSPVTQAFADHIVLRLPDCTAKFGITSLV